MTVGNSCENGTYTLLVQGSLSRRNGEALLTSDPADGSSWLVFYFDTQPSPRPTAGRNCRSESYSLLSEADRLEIDRFAMEMLHSWPDLDETRLETGPPLRDHCIDADLQKRLITYLQNLKIAEKLFERYAICRIHLGAGGGIRELAWEQFAERKELQLQHLEPDVAFRADELMPLLSLPPEVVSSGSPGREKKRGIARLRRGWGSRRDLERTVRSTRGGRLVFCTSRLVNQLYAQQIEIWNRKSDIQIFPAYVDGFRSFSGGARSLPRKAYRERWVEFSSRINNPEARPPSYCSQNLDKWLLDCFEGFFRRRYPRAQRTLDQAVEVLGRVKPAALLQDTQAGSEEGLWGLAAKNLGIPIYSYTYDVWPHRRTKWSPDYVLVNSLYTRRETLKQGFDEHQLIDVRSHRQLGISRLNDQEIAAIRARWQLLSGGPIVLCADTFFAGSTALQDPADSYGFYRAICLRARKDPGTTFILKFHPFRGRKKTKLGSMAFDQAALERRRAFIKELSPPDNMKLLAVDTPVQPLLDFVDLVLNINSVVALEAMQAKLPVLHFNDKYSLELCYPGLDAFGACNLADDVEGFADLIGRFLADGSLRDDLVCRQSRYLEECYWKHQTDMIEALMRHIESNVR